MLATFVISMLIVGVARAEENHQAESVTSSWLHIDADGNIINGGGPEYERLVADHKKEQMSALKLISDILIVKESHQVKEEHKYEHGIIEMPPLMKGAVNVQEKEEATA